MKPYERRAQGAYPYYKLATWDAISYTWRDGKRALATAGEAHAEAKRAGPGRYRISTVTDSGRVDGEPFTVEA